MIHYQSRMLMRTMREVPSEAEAVSHQLMLRAGLIRQLAAGIYTYMPLGKRVLRKLENIIREEMDNTGAQEIGMPAMQPADLWRETGRYDQYGPELIRLKDRHDREFALGPTHEEVVTALVRGEVGSYRQLPITLYQIQTKFRDEKRPRYGLLRGREFLMKDAYSFAADTADLDRDYDAMFEAYHRIMRRVGLQYRAVEADGGTIGDAGGTHEFMALADIGEDTIVYCGGCGYAANLEKAEYRNGSEQSSQTSLPYLAPPERIYTPNARTIEQLSAFLDIGADAIVKTLIYKADKGVIAVLVRGDHEVNEVKLKNALGAETLELADAETTERATGAPVGYAGPIHICIPIYADCAVMDMTEAVMGACEKDWHLKAGSMSQLLDGAAAGDYRNAAEGDCCPRCEEGRLSFSRGIEVGHVFKLGVKYSAAMGAHYLNAGGKSHHIVMGCYGIGVSRLLSAILEQNADEQGIVWPKSIAPYQAHIIPVSIKDETQRALAHTLASALHEAGVDVLLDDRDERPGVKFKDSDLIGIPHRFVVGKQAGEGLVEWRERTGQTRVVTVAEAAGSIAE